MCTHNLCFRAKNITIFHQKIISFRSVKYCSILHWRVFLMAELHANLFFLSFFFGQIILVCIGVGYIMSDLEHDVETVVHLCQHSYQHFITQTRPCNIIWLSH